MSVADILLAAVVAAGLGMLIYAFLVEPCRLQVTKVDIHIRELPENLEGFTICHLSDTHTGGYGRAERVLERMLGAIRADICVITGDLLRTRAGVGTLQRMLTSWKSRLGTFAVLGNGDYKLRIPVPELDAQFAESGIRLLLNDHVDFSSDGVDMCVIGVSDPYLGLDDLGTAMAGVPKGGFKLLLAHSPDILMKIGDEPVDLILAGHTHGGQVRVPFMGALWLHCRYHLGISDGCFGPEALSRLLGRDVHGTQMYVSRGIGGSGIRARFMCPPELVLVTLRREFRE